MPKKTNEEKVNDFFKPDENGVSEWKTWKKIEESELTFRRGQGNNHRKEIWWGVSKYKWSTEYNGRAVEKIRTTGFNTSDIKINRPVKPSIKDKLLSDYPYCINCGSHKNLCLDHKNDMYNDFRVLDSNTQSESDFQVLCNDCNLHLKHHVAYKKEFETKKLHKAKDFGKYPDDNFEYPWEKALTDLNDDPKDIRYINGYGPIHCKMYTYWYDIIEFARRRDWYIKFRPNLKKIQNFNKLIQQDEE